MDSNGFKCPKCAAIAPHLLIRTAIVPHHKEASDIEGGMSTWLHFFTVVKMSLLHTCKQSLSKQKQNHTQSTLFKSLQHPIIRPVISVQLIVCTPPSHQPQPVPV